MKPGNLPYTMLRRADREPTQAELNTATKDIVGHIICVSGHGVGKVVEFLNNGGFGVKSGHRIEFGDPFNDGSEYPNPLFSSSRDARPRGDSRWPLCSRRVGSERGKAETQEEQRNRVVVAC